MKKNVFLLPALLSAVALVGCASKSTPPNTEPPAPAHATAPASEAKAAPATATTPSTASNTATTATGLTQFGVPLCLVENPQLKVDALTASIKAGVEKVLAPVHVISGENVPEICRHPQTVFLQYAVSGKEVPPVKGQKTPPQQVPDALGFAFVQGENLILRGQGPVTSVEDLFAKAGPYAEEMTANFAQAVLDAVKAQKEGNATKAAPSTTTSAPTK